MEKIILVVRCTDAKRLSRKRLFVSVYLLLVKNTKLKGIQVLKNSHVVQSIFSKILMWVLPLAGLGYIHAPVVSFLCSGKNGEKHKSIQVRVKIEYRTLEALFYRILHYMFFQNAIYCSRNFLEWSKSFVAVIGNSAAIFSESTSHNWNFIRGI